MPTNRANELFEANCYIGELRKMIEIAEDAMVAMNESGTNIR